METTTNVRIPVINPGETAVQVSKYVDENGCFAIVPRDFRVSATDGEHTVNTGVVVIGPDGSEFVWVPTTKTSLATRDFGSYVYWGSDPSGYWDDTELELYQDMVVSVNRYGGFYMGRYEASRGRGSNAFNYIPASKSLARPWVRFGPQKAAVACQNLYADNETVQGFFPWGINYDTTLQWLIDSGCKTRKEIAKDSTSWGNYSNDTFSPNADGSATGVWEETKANNIYDLAGNNWEWTQERYGSRSYVMRGGGYNLMGGPCLGSDYTRIGPDIHGKPSIELSDQAGGRCYALFVFADDSFAGSVRVGDEVVLRGNLLNAREPFGMTMKKCEIVEVKQS